MKIVIENENVNVRSGNKDGRTWTIREQEARVMSDFIRGPIRITLGDNQEPHKAGEYDVDLERHIQIGRYGSIELTRTFHLNPLSKSSNLPFGKTGTN